MKLNLPNKLTLIRFILAPVFMIVLIIDFPFHYLISLIVFALASITDYYDGKIAREQNLVTNFGKFLDPIADKMITTAAFLGFTFLKIGYGIVWITFIVLLREFVVTSVRLAAADSGKVVAANMWGKSKTVMQMVAICVTLFLCFLSNIIELSSAVNLAFEIIYSSLLWISAILTFIAGITYIVENKDYINSNK